MNGKKKSYGILALCFLLVGVWADPLLAECPNKVSCAYDTRDIGNVAGLIDVATCYKFGGGCRPWHCPGAQESNRDYWTAQCMQRFSKCTLNNGCMAVFPGALSQ